MKGLYSMLLSALMSVIALSAQASSYTIDIDNPANIEFWENWTEKSSELSPGIQTRQFDGNQIGMQVKAKTGVTITSATVNGSSINLNFFYIKNGDNLVIRTESTNEHYYFYVTITDGVPAEVSLTHYVNDISQRVNLPTGTNDQVEFTKGESFTFGPADWSAPALYEVKVGDTPLQPNATGRFIYNPQNDGEKVYVTVKAPIIEFPVHFSLSDGADGLFTKVEVDGAEVAGWNGKDDLNVETGKTVKLYLDTENYSITSLKKDGYTISYSDGKCEFTVDRETTISADAHRYAEYDLTINASGKEFVKAYIGNPVTGQEIALNDKTTLKISEKNNVVTVVPRPSSHISTVKLNGNELSPNDNNEYTAVITANSTLEIQAGAIIREKAAYIYVNDALYAQDLYIASRNSEVNVSLNDLQQWYREVKFSELDNPFSIMFLADLNDYIEVRHNYIKLDTPENDDNNNITFGNIDLSDGDIIQIYLNSTAIDRDVTFNIGETIDGFTLKRDLVKDVTDYTSPLTVPEGTVLEFTTATKVECTVNGKPLEDVDGKYTVQVFTPLVIDLVDPNQKPDSISAIATDTDEAAQWYTLTGIRLSSRPQQAGVYICRTAGKAEKVMVIK